MARRPSSPAPIALGAVFLLLATSAALAQAPAVTLVAKPDAYEGPCPTGVELVGEVTAAAPGTVRVQTVRSDGSLGLEHALAFDAPGAKTITDIWVPAPQAALEGWALLRVLGPAAVDSARAAVKVKCTEMETTGGTDLVVELAASTDAVGLGQELTWTLLASNRGPLDATAVRATLRLPSGARFVSASQGCAAEGAAVTCQVGALARQASAAFTVTAAASSGTEALVATASVSAAEKELAPASNEATLTTGVRAAVNLKLSGAPEPDPVGANAALAFAFHVENEGPSDATKTTFRGELPADFPVSSATASQGACTVSGTAVACELGTLAAGARVEVKLQGEARTKSTVLVVTGRVTCAERDGNDGDDVAAVPVSVDQLGTPED